MGAATVTKRSYGYSVTGDTGTVTVDTGRLQLMGFGWTPATNSAACVVQDGAGNVLLKMIGAVAADTYLYDLFGIYVDGLIVYSLTNATDVLHIYLE